MKFYIDFEATQYTERIISIGCVAENGKVFSSLVTPHKNEKITKFITNLTGITNEMLEGAPSADEAFVNFFHFVNDVSNGERPEYYCYGPNDVRYIEKTVKKMTNFIAITFACSLAQLLTDYSKEVNNFFCITGSNGIGLNRLYNFLRFNEIPQKHDALEDAIMLQYVENNLLDKCLPTDVNFFLANRKIASPSSQEKKTVVPHSQRNPKIPSCFYDWEGQKMFRCDTGANETNWKVKFRHNDGRTRYFPDMETAIMWTIKYLVSNHSPLKEKHVKKIEEVIINHSEKEIKYYGGYWEVKN